MNLTPQDMYFALQVMLCQASKTTKSTLMKDSISLLLAYL